MVEEREKIIFKTFQYIKINDNEYIKKQLKYKVYKILINNGKKEKKYKKNTC